MPLKVKRAIEIIEAAGWELARHKGSSHRQYRKTGNPNVVTVPGHPRDDVPAGTLATIRRLTGIEELR
jgi:predicted RNA binding protein YcfA (HicA-like mRNA interferase family)